MSGRIVAATPKDEELKDSDVLLGLEEEQEAKEGFKMGIPSSSLTPQVEFPAASETDISDQEKAREDSTLKRQRLCEPFKGDNQMPTSPRQYLKHTIDSSNVPRGPRTPITKDQIKAAVPALLDIKSDLLRMVKLKPENLMFEQVVQVDTTGHYMIVLPQEIATQHKIDENPVEGTILILRGRECQVCPVLIKPQLEIKEFSGSSFWVKNNLAPNDMVQFYKPIDPEHSQQFVVDCYKFVCQTEASHAQLHIPKQDVKHFTKGTTDNAVTKGEISMFDTEGKKWKMELVSYKASNALEITGNWKEFYEAHNLKAGDAIRIYRSNVEDKYLIRVDRDHVMTKIIEQEENAYIFSNVAGRFVNIGSDLLRQLDHDGSFANFSNPDMEAAMEAAITLFGIGRNLSRKVEVKLIPIKPIFEQVVQADTTGHYMIVLPQEITVQHKIIDANSVEGTLLILCGRECQVWPMVINYPQLEIKELSGGLFWVKNNLVSDDMVQFYKPIKPEHSQQFVVDCYKFLFKKTLSQTEASHAQLHVPKQHVKHFAKGTTDKAVTKEEISIFGTEGERWKMELVFYKASVKITGRWKAFCAAHNLKAGDGIRIYRSNVDQDKYLIRVDRNHVTTDIQQEDNDMVFSNAPRRPRTSNANIGTDLPRQEMHARVFIKVSRRPRTIRNANTDAARPLSRTLEDAASWNLPRRSRTPRTALRQHALCRKLED